MRRKLIEQVIEAKNSSNYSMIETMSAGNTSAHASASFDREGYLSARIACQAKGNTGADTQEFTFYVYDSSDNSTYAIYDSANATVSIAPGSSAVIDGFDVDLAGAKKYIKVYATVTGATTIAATVSAACILGDAVEEPAT